MLKRNITLSLILLLSACTSSQIEKDGICPAPFTMQSDVERLLLSYPPGTRIHQFYYMHKKQQEELESYHMQKWADQQ